MRTFARLALTALLTTFVFSSSSRASNKLRLERLDFSHAPTLKTYLTLTDAEGRVLSGYEKAGTKLILDSAEQGAASSLQTFEESGDPINLVIVIQVSQSMLEVADEVKKSVKMLSSAVSPKSRVALLAFSADTKRLAEMGNPADAESAASSLTVDTETVEVHVLDALHTAVDLLNAAPKEQRKLVVLFSDGIDVNMEKKAFFSIGKKAVEAGVVIDTIGYAPFERARLRNLTELTKQSNGGERECKNAADVTTEFQNVADEIRKQYVATFELALAGGDGKFHTFQTTMETAGRVEYSNNVIRPVPAATHPVVAKKEGRRWWLWALIAFGVLGLVVLVVWLIFRDKEEEPMPMPQQQRGAAPAPSRTMAIGAQSSGGKVTAVGWLVGVNGRHADKTFPLKSGGRTVIGTAADCDIVIEDGFASSRHAEVRLEGTAFRIVDLGSTNGLSVNDKKVKNHELVDNDRLVIGRTELKFKSVVQ